MPDTSPPAESGAEAPRIVVTTSEDVTAKAIASEEKWRVPDLDQDANPEAGELPEPSTDTDDESDDEPDDKKGKPPRGVQKRLDELTRQRHEATRRADALEMQLTEALKALNQGQPPAQHQPHIDPNAPPDPQNYRAGDADVDFYRDMARWEARAEIQSMLQQAERAKTVETIASREDTARAKYQDYNDVVTPENLAPIRANPDLFEVVASHEAGPELAYYLGKNPEEAIALSRMNPYQASIRLGQLIATLSPEATAPTRNVSRAPAPISPMRGNGASPAVNYEAKLAEAEQSGNFDLWRKLKAAQKSGK